MLATVSVFASGATGEEAFNLIIDNEIVATHTDVGGNFIGHGTNQYDYFTDAEVDPSTVKVEFFNDMTPSEIDRQLLVDRIIIDGHVFHSEDINTYSTGFINYEGNFTGAGFKRHEILNVNGTFSYDQENPDKPKGTRIRVDAVGETGEENLQVQINGQTVRNFGFFQQRADLIQSFAFVVDEFVDIEDVRIRFTNDAIDPVTGEDRNLTVLNFQTIDLESGQRQVALPTDQNVYSTGVFTEADGIKPGFARGNTLSTFGFFEVRDETRRIRVDASGSTGEEVMEIRIGNEVLGQFEVSTSTQQYFVDINRDFNFHNIRIAFVNDVYDESTGYDRNLIVHSFQKIDMETLERDVAFPTDANVFSTGTFVEADGISPGFGRGNTLNANGFFQIRETDSFQFDRRISGDAYFVKVDDGSGSLITASGPEGNSLIGHTLSLFDSSGNPVRNFGNNGTVVWTDVADVAGWNKTRIEDIDFMADGSIIVTAQRVPGIGLRAIPYVLKLDSQGNVDDSFAINGLLAQTPIGNGSNRLFTLPENDGHITIVGQSANSNTVALSHYAQFGNLDQSYGNGGHRILTGTTLAGAEGLSIGISGAQALPDDSVIVMASVRFRSSSVQSIVKLKSDGSIDTSFGDNGVTRIGSLGASGFEIDSKGRIVVSKSNFILRFTADGQLDQSFGDNGSVTITRDDNFSGSNILVDSEDRIVIVGNRSTDATFPDLPSFLGASIVRLNESGTLDASFHWDGIQDFSNFTVGSATLRSPLDADFDAEGNLIIGLGQVGTDRGVPGLSRLRMS